MAFFAVDFVSTRCRWFTARFQAQPLQLASGWNQSGFAVKGCRRVQSTEFSGRVYMSNIRIRIRKRSYTNYMKPVWNQSGLDVKEWRVQSTEYSDRVQLWGATSTLSAPGFPAVRICRRKYQIVLQEISDILQYGFGADHWLSLINLIFPLFRHMSLAFDDTFTFDYLLFCNPGERGSSTLFPGQKFGEETWSSSSSSSLLRSWTSTFSNFTSFESRANQICVILYSPDKHSHQLWISGF